MDARLISSVNSSVNSHCPASVKTKCENNAPYVVGAFSHSISQPEILGTETPVVSKGWLHPSRAHIDAVTAHVAGLTGISVKDLRSAKRTRKVCRARWLAWRQLHDVDGYGFAGIARAWGCDHTSVMNAKAQGWGIVE